MTASYSRPLFRQGSFLVAAVGLILAGQSRSLGDEEGPGQGDPGQSTKLIEWKWDEGYPKIDGNKLVAKGRVVLVSANSTVSEGKFRLKISSINGTWPTNEAPYYEKATIGSKTFLAAENKWYYAVTSETAIGDQAPDYIVPAGWYVKVIPNVLWSLTGTGNTWSELDPPGVTRRP